MRITYLIAIADNGKKESEMGTRRTRRNVRKGYLDNRYARPRKENVAIKSHAKRFESFSIKVTKVEGGVPR